MYPLRWLVQPRPVQAPVCPLIPSGKMNPRYGQSKPQEKGSAVRASAPEECCQTTCLCSTGYRVRSRKISSSRPSFRSGNLVGWKRPALWPRKRRMVMKSCKTFWIPERPSAIAITCGVTGSNTSLNHLQRMASFRWLKYMPELTGVLATMLAEDTDVALSIDLSTAKRMETKPAGDYLFPDLSPEAYAEVLKLRQKKPN